MPGGSRQGPSLLTPHTVRSVFWFKLQFCLGTFTPCFSATSQVKKSFWRKHIICQLGCPFIFLSDLFYPHCLKIILDLDKMQLSPLEVELSDCFHAYYLTSIPPVPYPLPFTCIHTTHAHPIYTYCTHTPPLVKTTCFKMRLYSPGCREITQLFT